RAADNFKLAQRFLAELPRAVVEPAERQFFTEAAAAIADELSFDNFLSTDSADPSRSERLDSFLTLAQQAEQQRRQGQNPEQGPRELLSLAVSGWVLGGKSADTKFETARRL